MPVNTRDNFLWYLLNGAQREFANASTAYARVTVGKQSAQYKYLYRMGQKSRPLRLKADIFCLYLQNA